MTGRVPHYFMDDPREAKRLAAKVNAKDWVQRYLGGRMTPGACVLDVGCGPGILAAEIARQFPESRLTAIDISDERIEEAKRNLSPFPTAAAIACDAGNLPFADESFDIVFSRMLMEYLPDKQKAVEEFIRVCRSGGIVILQDLDGQLSWHYPPDEDLELDTRRVLAELAKTGFDPFVGRKLFSMLQIAGLHNINVTVESYHVFAGCIDPENLRLWKLKLDIALPAAKAALGSLDAAIQLNERFLAYLQREDSLTYSVVFTVSGLKR